MTDIEADIQEQMTKLERQAFLEKLKQPAAPYVPPPVLPDTAEQLRKKVEEQRRIERLKQPATWTPPPPDKPGRRAASGVP
jgi:hypothetical protein